MANHHHKNWNFETAGIVIGYLMMILSIGQTAFFVCMISFKGSEIIFIITLWIFVFNLLATILWLSGIGKNMIRLMLASLVWWSISLCLWFRFIFLTTRNINPEDSIRNILLYVLTAILFSLYVFAIISYKSLGGIIERKRLDALRLAV